MLSTYDANDRLLATGSVSYTYDPRGNVASRNQAGAVSTFGWTSDNRLASVTNVNGTTAFAYDADGTRVAKSSAAGTIRYLVDSVNPTGLRQALEERDAGGGLVATHQFGLGLLSSSKNSVERYVLTDGQASVRMLADAAGQVTDQVQLRRVWKPGGCHTDQPTTTIVTTASNWTKKLVSTICETAITTRPLAAS